MSILVTCCFEILRDTECWFGLLACKNRSQNDLLCVEWDVKPYTLTHLLWLPLIRGLNVAESSHLVHKNHQFTDQ